MFNIKDLVKYRTPMNPKSNWGVIVEILEVKDSVYGENKGLTLYKVNSLEPNLSYLIVEEKDLIQAYSMYYEENKEMDKECS